MCLGGHVTELTPLPNRIATDHRLLGWLGVISGWEGWIWCGEVVVCVLDVVPRGIYARVLVRLVRLDTQQQQQIQNGDGDGRTGSRTGLGFVHSHFWSWL